MRRERIWSAVAATVLCGLVAACQGRLERASAGGESSADAGYDEDYDAGEDAFADDEGFDSEGDRTAAMEAHAADARQRFDEAMADATSDEERIRAYEQFEQDRLELNEMAESESVDDEGDAYPPPPSS